MLENARSPACLDFTMMMKSSAYPPDLIAARFHRRLVSIHPFPNGNGRHSREMANLLLKNILKHPEFTWGRLNLAEAGSIRKQYIESLHAADGGNYEPLLAFVRT